MKHRKTPEDTGKQWETLKHRKHWEQKQETLGDPQKGYTRYKDKLEQTEGKHLKYIGEGGQMR